MTFLYLNKAGRNFFRTIYSLAHKQRREKKETAVFHTKYRVHCQIHLFCIVSKVYLCGQFIYFSIFFEQNMCHLYDEYLLLCFFICINCFNIQRRE